MNVEATLNQVLFGDVRRTLRDLPERLFHCVVTSPPYWNLRSYLKADDPMKGLEIGSERTPDEFVATMVDVFRAVRRVLRDDGVLFLNMGDSYATAGGKCFNPGGGSESLGQTRKAAGVHPLDRGNVSDLRRWGVQDGDQLLMPHRVAMAMQADGWILRSTIIWAKKSPMPESIAGWRWVKCRVKVAGQIPIASNQRGTNHRDPSINSKPSFNEEFQHAKFSPCPGCDKCRDNNGLVLRRGKWRPTTAHEYVFMFSKGERYFCDGDAVQEQCTPGTVDRLKSGPVQGQGRNPKAAQYRTDGRVDGYAVAEKRNPRSVWSLSSEPYKGAHFATFPTELARRCIAASTSSAGCCPACGAPHAPVVQSERVATRPGENTKVPGRNSRMYQERDPQHPGEYKADRYEMEVGNRDPQRHVAVSRVTGYLPTCRCAAAPSAPCRVLDPFGGSGTVGQVAHHLGCDYVLCELNRDYLPLIEARIKTLPRWKSKVKGKPRAIPHPDQMTLFT